MIEKNEVCGNCGFSLGQHALDCPNNPTSPTYQPPDNPNNARLTIVEKVYHQRPGRDATLTHTSLSRSCTFNEQPYFREDVEVGNGWEKVDLGWIKSAKVGYVIIQNKEQGPTGKILEVVSTTHVQGYPDKEATGFLIFPRDSLRVYPIAPTCLWIRARIASDHIIRYNLTVFAS